MFKGLCAFPLTPVNAQGIDEKGFLNILSRLTAAKVNSLGILGSTGSYAYLTREQRQRITLLAKQHAGEIPMMVGIGAFSTKEILSLADDAQHCGADALLLPALSYQQLTTDEVFNLYQTVTRQVSVPICVYDNPGTTHFEFSDELYQRLADLSGIHTIKIPPVANITERVSQLREKLPEDVAIGISGDAVAGAALNAGCDIWYSVCGGLFPVTAKKLTEAAAKGDNQQVTELANQFEPLWRLFRKHGGSIRVMAAAAGVLGLTGKDCLPRPLLPMSEPDSEEVASVIDLLDLE